LAWLQQVFEPRTQEKAQGRSHVLICDDHDSYITGRFIRHRMNHNIKLLILPPHSSHYTQPLNIEVFSSLKHYLLVEISGIIQAEIARVFKGEWAKVYSKSQLQAFTISNINGSWVGSGLYSFQSRKVLHRALVVIPSPSSSLKFNSNVFDDALFMSSSSEMAKMYNANQALQTIFTNNTVLHTSERNYICCLGQRAEALHARVGVLKKQKQNNDAVLSSRRAIKSERRISIEGEHLLTTDTIYQRVSQMEVKITKRKNKSSQKGKEKKIKVYEALAMDEDEVEVLDEIQYPDKLLEPPKLKYATAFPNTQTSRPPSDIHMDVDTPGRSTENLTDLEVAYILGLCDGGATTSEIIEKTGRSKSAINKTLTRYDYKTFTGVTPPPGNPKILSERKKRNLVRVVRKHRRKTLSDITNILPDNPSVRTLQRELKEVGIQKHIAIKKPWISDENKQKRLDWCRAHKDWPLSKWMKVIFSDECKVEIGKDARAIWVFRDASEKYCEDCLVSALKGPKASIMVWGCFSANKLGPLLTFSKGGISSAEYIDTLKNGLLPFIEQLNNIPRATELDAIHVCTIGDYIFQQDNAPIHTSQATRRFFQSHRLEVMDWPANSPDLNPIEHLWPHLKTKFHHEFEALGTKKPSRSEGALELYAGILKRVWAEELEAIAQSLVESMPRRIDTVIAAGGGPTRY